MRKQHELPPTHELPPPQVLRLHLFDAEPANIAAGFVSPAKDPGWLSISITGTAPDFEIAVGLRPNAPTFVAGTWSVDLTIGTLDAMEKALQIRKVQISLTVLEKLSVATSVFARDFVFGHSTSSASTDLRVTTDPTTEWRLTASAPWITVPTGQVTGSGQTRVTIDASELAVGQYTGSVIVASTMDPMDSATIVVTANVVAPTFDVSPLAITLGGSDGLDATSGQALQLSLGTGSATHPWSATLTSESGGAWMTVDSASGVVGSTPATVEVNADRALVVPGSYHGAVRLDVVVRGQTFSRTVPVTFNKEGHWLYVSSLGAAFSSFPGRSVLTRTLQVRSSQSRTDVPWTAESDQSWLSVTQAGVTGGGVTLTANPAGLAAERQYFARVTVTSSDHSILNSQTVRVGLWVGSTDPGDVTIANVFRNVATNPVEPYVYTNTGNGNVTVYDVYSGAVVHTFASAVAQAGRMTVSSDGKILFVNDDTNLQVVALDAETGSELRRYPWGTTAVGALAYARPNAQPILLIGSGRAFDVATGEIYSAGIGGTSLEVDANSQFVYSQDTGLSPTSLAQYAISFTALNGRGLVVHLGHGTFPGFNGQDICVSGDGSRVYSANGAPYVFSVFDTFSLQQIQTLPGDAYPSNAACGWNGLFFGGAQAYYDPVNVWVYRPNGTLVTSFAMHPGYIINLLPDTLVLSGDNTRVMASTQESSATFDIRNAPSG